MLKPKRGKTLGIGGAALTEKFTYGRIAAKYDGAVAYARDAMQKAIDDGAVSGEPEISARRVGGNRLDVAVTYTSRGQTNTLRTVF